jgi:hypothetical protein
MQEAADAGGPLSSGDANVPARTASNEIARNENRCGRPPLLLLDLDMQLLSPSPAATLGRFTNIARLDTPSQTVGTS